MNKSTVGVGLKLLRTSAGLTLESVANRSGFSPSYISRVENGRTEPTPEWTKDFVRAVGEIASERTKFTPAA